MKLETISKRVRRHTEKIIKDNFFGHMWGALSMIDALVVLYFYKMKKDDYFILSKGHGVTSLYVVLAEKGYFPKKELKKIRKFGGMCPEHPDMRKTPGITFSTGSLGMGISTAAGIAMSLKMDHKKNQVYCIIGDGECDEGQVWETAMSAAHYRLDNLTVILDRNGWQRERPTEETMKLEPLFEKWSSFGWEVSEIDGYHIPSLMLALDLHWWKKPKLIIAETRKECD